MMLWYLSTTSCGVTPSFLAYGNGHPMFVAAANESHLFALHSEVTGINIGRYVNSGQVANVNRSVGIRQRGRNQGAFVITHLKYSAKKLGDKDRKNVENRC